METGKRTIKSSDAVRLLVNGTKSDERFQRFSGSLSQTPEPQRRSGSGKEVLLNILTVEVNGTVATFSMRKWETEKHIELVYNASRRLSRVTLPLTAPCWSTLANGEHVVGAVVQLGLR